MTELLWKLFWEFFKTGLFALGGGLATIPFLYDMMDKFHWFTQSDLLNMIAVSESTPGPMGVNMATYVGFHTAGNSILGAFMATFGLVLPSVIIVCLVAKILQKFKSSHWVQDAFYGLRPAVTALISAAGFSVLLVVIYPEGLHTALQFNWINILLLLAFGVLAFSWKKLHPIALICLCACVGIILQL